MEMPPLELPLTDLEFVEVKEEHANTEEEYNPQEHNSHSTEPDPVLWPSSDSQEKTQNGENMVLEEEGMPDMKTEVVEFVTDKVEERSSSRDHTNVVIPKIKKLNGKERKRIKGKVWRVSKDKALAKMRITATPTPTTSDEDLFEEPDQMWIGECQESNDGLPPEASQTLFSSALTPPDTQGCIVKLEEVDVTPTNPPACRDSQPQRKYRRICTFDEATERRLAEWYRDHEMLYNKKLRAYRDKARKDRLYQQKAKELGTTADVLLTWLEGMRTRYARQCDRWSGPAAPALSEREQWIQTAFNFLRPHIVRCRSRRAKRHQIEEPIGAHGPGVAAGGSADEAPVYDHPPVDDDNVEPQPSTSTESSKCHHVYDDSLLMERIKQTQQETSDLNAKLTALLTPRTPHATAAKQFHSYLATQAEQIDPVHWTRYTMDAIQLLSHYVQLSTSSSLSQVDPAQPPPIPALAAAAAASQYGPPPHQPRTSRQQWPQYGQQPRWQQSQSRQ